MWGQGLGQAGCERVLGPGNVLQSYTRRSVLHGGAPPARTSQQLLCVQNRFYWMLSLNHSNRYLNDNKFKLFVHPLSTLCLPDGEEWEVFAVLTLLICYK